MLEQDEILRALSQREDRAELTPNIVETLGLRGHLQRELVRIERMLAEDDPELKVRTPHLSHKQLHGRRKMIGTSNCISCLVLLR